MALQTTYTFSGIDINNAYIRIERLWGSSREGWSALVGVYNQGSGELQKVTEFNHSCAWEESVRGYVSMYNSLQAKYEGTKV